VAHTFSPSTWEAEAGGFLSEFQASLVYRESSRTARVTQRNPVSKKKTKNPHTVHTLILHTHTAHTGTLCTHTHTHTHTHYSLKKKEMQWHTGYYGFKILYKETVWQWRYTPLIAILGRQRQVDL
jgi:hypothetical protein